MLNKSSCTRRLTIRRDQELGTGGVRIASRDRVDIVLSSLPQILQVHTLSGKI